MKIQKKDLMINIGISILLILCVALSHIKAASYLSLIIFCVYWIYLILHNRLFLVKYLAFIFAAVGTVAGVAVIELGSEFFLPELRCESHYSGSLPLLIFSYWFFVFVLQVCDHNFGHRVQNYSITWKRADTVKTINMLSGISAVLLLGLLVYEVMRAPSALSLGIDRFVYAMNYPLTGVWAKLSSASYLLLVFPLLSLAYGNRVIAVMAIVSYALSSFWTGEKFGAFFTLLCIMLIVFYNKLLSIDKKKVKKLVIIIGIGGAILIVLAANIATSSGRTTAGSYLYLRTAQQGQLWWKTFDLYHNAPHPMEFQNEIKAFFAGNNSISESVGAQNGIYKVMYLCAPESVVTAKLETGSRYSQADYAAVYYYFGVAGTMVYSLIMGVVISGIVNGFIRMLNRNDYIKAFIFVRFFMLIKVSFSMFLFSDFIDLVSILSYIYLIIFAKKVPKLSTKRRLSRFG